MSVKYLYLVVAAVMLGGCAPAVGTSEMGRPTAPRKANILTAEEIVGAEADQTTAYDAIARLRPIWLTPRGPSSFYGTGTDYPALFIDGQAFSDFRALRTIQANQVADIRFYRPDEAGAAFGLRAGSAGAIEVRLRIANHPPVP
ncbi:MAG TPA: hypothetical protein VFS56_00885 [Gemmatimonadaceae bacterium]|nr:hypothetical protein [Gemmatimonadaceae bacterium]